MIFKMVVNISSPVLGGQGVNIWHGRNTGDAPLEVAELHDLSEMVHSFYTDVAALFQGDTRISFDGEVTSVGEDEPTLHSAGGSWAVVGGTTVENLPPANALVVGWRTSSATRSGRGRTFLGPLSRDCLQDNGTPEESVRTIVQEAADDLIGKFDEFGDGALGVWSPKQGVLRDFTGANVANKFAVLRSRRD